MKKLMISSAIIVLISVNSLLFAQIPAGVEAKYDALMKEYVKIFEIILDNNESDALMKMDAMVPRLSRLAEDFSVAVEPYQDISPEEEKEWDEKIKAKPYYKKIMEYFSNEQFIAKWQGSTAIQNKMEEISSIMDIGLEEEEESEASGSAGVAASVDIPSLSENYSISPETEENAVAYEDDLGNLTVDIIGYADDKEVTMYFFTEGVKTGKYDWSTEGNFIIEIYDENGEQLHGYWGNEEMGYIQIDHIGEKGDYVTGSFSGKFMDDMNDGESYTTISGTFQARYGAMGY